MQQKERSTSMSKRESVTSVSRLSVSAPPFNFNSKTHDQGPSFNYNLAGCYVPCDDSFENQPDSYLFRYPSESEPESYLIDSGAAASIASNSIFKLDENTPYSMGNNFSQAREIKPSVANSTLLLHKLCFSECLDSCGDAAVNGENFIRRLSEVDVGADAAVVKCENYSAFNPSAIMEAHVLQNAKNMIACRENFLVDRGKEKQNCEIVINGAMGTLVKAKKDSSPAVPDDFNVESHNDESFVPVQTSSIMSDSNDSDVDSPCWRGTGFRISAFRDPDPISSEIPKIEGESRKSLNPLAPHFFPGSVKSRVDCHGNKFEKSDSSSFNKAVSSFALSFKEHSSTDFVKAGTSSSEVSNAIGTRTFNDTCDVGKEYSLRKKLSTSSTLHSSFVDGPCLVKEDLTFNGQDVTGPDVSGSLKAMKSAVLDGSTGASFSPKGNHLTSFFSRDGGASSHFCETLGGAPKSTPPKIDVQLVINTMHDLSELIRWNCSNDLNSLNEHEHDMIQRIINNLHVCITNKVQERVSKSESGHQCASYCPVKLTGCQKVTKMKPMTVSNDWEREKSLVSSSRSDEGINIGDDVPQDATCKLLESLERTPSCGKNASLTFAEWELLA